MRQTDTLHHTERHLGTLYQLRDELRESAIMDQWDAGPDLHYYFQHFACRECWGRGETRDGMRHYDFCPVFAITTVILYYEQLRDRCRATLTQKGNRLASRVIGIERTL